MNKIKDEQRNLKFKGYLDTVSKKFEKTSFFKSNKEDMNEIKDIFKGHYNHYVKYSRHYKRFFNIYFYSYIIGTIY